MSSYQFSLRILIAVVTFVCLVFAVLANPRGRINRQVVSELTDNMSIDEASKIIGLPPGEYDGVSGGGMVAKDAYGWANLNGIIYAEYDNGITSYRFERHPTIIPRFSVSALIFERLLLPVYESDSKWASVFLLLFPCVSGMILLALFSWTFQIKFLVPLYWGIAASAIVYVTFSFGSSTWVHHHRDEHFFKIARAMAIGATVVPILIMFKGWILWIRKHGRLWEAGTRRA